MLVSKGLWEYAGDPEEIQERRAKFQSSSSPTPDNNVQVALMEEGREFQLTSSPMRELQERIYLLLGNVMYVVSDVQMLTLL